MVRTNKIVYELFGTMPAVASKAISFQMRRHLPANLKIGTCGKVDFTMQYFLNFFLRLSNAVQKLTLGGACSFSSKLRKLVFSLVCEIIILFFLNRINISQ